MNSVCGINCFECGVQEICGGCVKTGGRPFDGECLLAKCCQSKGCEHCAECTETSCKLKSELIAEFNSLEIEDMEEITDLNALKGSFVNLEFTLLNGQKVKFFDDNKIYLGNQICKKCSNRCYGLAADENNLLVCEYGENGCDPEIVVYKKRDHLNRGK